jgi:glycosyltransferase involved in cell wall biosynthesis
MIVSDLGWMGELPNDVAAKIAVDATISELAQACGQLLDDAESRDRLSRRAREYSKEHSFEAAARALLAVLDEMDPQSARPGRSSA